MWRGNGEEDERNMEMREKGEVRDIYVRCVGELMGFIWVLMSCQNGY